MAFWDDIINFFTGNNNQDNQEEVQPNYSTNSVDKIEQYFIPNTDTFSEAEQQINNQKENEYVTDKISIKPNTEIYGKPFYNDNNYSQDIQNSWFDYTPMQKDQTFKPNNTKELKNFFVPNNDDDTLSTIQKRQETLGQPEEFQEQVINLIQKNTRPTNESNFMRQYNTFDEYLQQQNDPIKQFLSSFLSNQEAIQKDKFETDLIKNGYNPNYGKIRNLYKPGDSITLYF